MKRYWITLVFFSMLCLSYSQTNPEKQLGTWYMFNGKHLLSEKLSLNTGMQFRYYEPITNYNLNLFYTGFNYQLKPRTVLTVNYGYLDIDRSIEFTNVTNTVEHRIWEQVLYKHKLIEIPINHRLRLEHRILHNINNDNVQNRIRYRLGTRLPLNATLALILNNEFFVNLEGETFRENRAYGALGIKIDKQLQLQLGYLRQHINDLDLNRLQLGLSLTTDFRKH